jgi:excisionase family DNA binding protein
MLTLAQAAERLGVSRETLRWQVKNGKLRARKVGPVWTVSEREIERYRAEHKRATVDHEPGPSVEFVTRAENIKLRRLRP